MKLELLAIFSTRKLSHKPWFTLLTLLLPLLKCWLVKVETLLSTFGFRVYGCTNALFVYDIYLDGIQFGCKLLRLWYYAAKLSANEQ